MKLEPRVFIQPLNSSDQNPSDHQRDALELSSQLPKPRVSIANALVAWMEATCHQIIADCFRLTAITLW